MSLSAIVRAVRDELRSGLGLPDYECEIMAGPEPPAFSGQWFFSVYGNSWRPGPAMYQEEGTDELYGVSVMATLRTGEIPDDLLGIEAYIKDAIGIEFRLRDIVSHLTNNRIKVMNSATLLLPAGELGFIEPLRWLGCDATAKRVGPEWFKADMSEEDELSSFFGLAMEARFGEARRMQKLPDVR